ncbi:MAG: DUF86 domain-containing protein [Prevotella sp.]|nr:DUF86 domain-containing protein [Prevotella sp.]MBP3220350.1 DUF86 domain-containing protein [Prevotella sp.]
MRERLKDKNRLEHIKKAIDTILDRVEGMDYDTFKSDKILYGGIVYYTMIIGEAAYKLSPQFVSAYTEIAWQDIADMRHHLVHGYYQVDSSIVWAVVQHDLKPLRTQIDNLLSIVDWEEWESRNSV